MNTFQRVMTTALGVGLGIGAGLIGWVLANDEDGDSPPVESAAPPLFYSGTLTDDCGLPLDSGAEGYTFRLTVLASEDATTGTVCEPAPVGVQRGHFRIELPPACAAAVVAAPNSSLQVEVKAGDEPFVTVGESSLGSVPHARAASSAHGLLESRLYELEQGLKAQRDGMVFIPAGTFPMGSPANGVVEPANGVDPVRERPLHLVSLSAFLIDRYEVTTAAYAIFMSAHGNLCAGMPCMDTQKVSAFIDEAGVVQSHCQATSGGPATASCGNHPAIPVTWNGAKAYCESVGKRLPTEAEWERVANGPGGPEGTDWRRYPWSSPCAVTGSPAEWSAAEDCFAESVLGRANCCEEIGKPSSACDVACADGFEKAAPVGSFEGGVSVEGVHDMAGNALEWVSDYYDEDYYSTLSQSSPVSNPTGPESGTMRVTRGGDHNYGAFYQRNAYRQPEEPSAAGSASGFRCARSIP